MSKKEILIIHLIICENGPTIAAVENNPAALSELLAAHFWAAAHHLGTPGLHHFSTFSVFFFMYIVYLN
jgi:hypothetical protein